MGLIIEGLVALCLALLVFWLLSLRSSAARDRAEAQRRQTQEQEARDRAEREARLYRQGEKLRCLGCEKTFTGPLSDTGCPHCHLSALVVPESDPRAGPQTAQNIGFHRKGE